MKVSLWRIFCLLGLVKSCIAGLARPSSLGKRLCNADYVFKFYVTSDARRSCLNIHRINTNLPTAKPSPASSDAPSIVTSPVTPRVVSNIKTPTPSLRPPSTASHGKDNRLSNDSSFALRPSRVRLQPTTYSASSSGAATARNHMGPGGFCIQVDHQNITIKNQQVYKGLADLRNMNNVKVMSSGDDLESSVRLGLNFANTLKLNTCYLFIGRRIPKGNVADHVFMINHHTVVPCSKVKNEVIKFNFDIKCVVTRRNLKFRTKHIKRDINNHNEKRDNETITDQYGEFLNH